MFMAPWICFQIGAWVAVDVIDHSRHPFYFAAVTLALTFAATVLCFQVLVIAVKVRRVNPTQFYLPPADNEQFGIRRCCGADVESPSLPVLVAACRYCGTQHLVAQRARRAVAVAAMKLERTVESLVAAHRDLRAKWRRIEDALFRFCCAAAIASTLWLVIAW